MHAILLGKGTNRVGLGLGTRCIITLDINDAMSGCGSFEDVTAGLAAPQTLVAAAGPSMAGIAAAKA